MMTVHSAVKPETSSSILWWLNHRKDAGGNELLLVVGAPTGIVVARIAAGEGAAWTLTLDVHLDLPAQCHIRTASITEAIKIAECWVVKHQKRLTK